MDTKVDAIEQHAPEGGPSGCPSPEPTGHGVVRFLVAVALLCAIGGTWAWADVDSTDLIDTREPSQAVYPPHSYQVNFDHAVHARSSPCPLCHRMVAASPDDEPRTMPSMETCGRCHTQAADTEDPLACATCHADYRPVWPQEAGMLSARDPRFPLVRPAAPIRLEANLHFGHATHTNFPCVTCHPLEIDGGATLPLEEQCLECHRGVGAPSQCSACHPTGADGRLVTRTPTSRQVSGQVLRPQDHGGSWDHDHGAAVAAAPEACFQCHSEQDCLGCHDASIGIRTIHPPGHVSDHGLDARRSGSTCAACHTVGTFCVNCHVEAGYGDDGSHGLPQGYRYHPEGWYDIDGAHGYSAQRNLVECASCHQESHCARCHQTVSPHGADFRSRCGALMSANPQLCTRCHDQETLEMITERCR